METSPFWQNTPFGYILGDVFGVSAKVNWDRTWNVYKDGMIVDSGSAPSLDTAKVDAEKAYENWLYTAF